MMANGSIIQENGSEGHRNGSSFSSPECIAWLTVLTAESVSIVTLNILTIVVFIRNRSLRKRSMYLVINLAVADTLVGGISEPAYLVQVDRLTCNIILRYEMTSSSGIQIIEGIQLLFLAASLTNLAAISLERMHATFRPFKHRVIKNWVLGVVIIVTWVTAGLFSTAVGLIWRKRLSNFYVWCSLNFICLFTFFVCYMSIVMKINCGTHLQHHGAASREGKLTKTLFILTLVSLMMWLPLLLASFLYYNTDIIRSLPELIIRRVNISANALCFANSLVNPVLYLVRMPEFRRALGTLFRRQHRHVQVQIPLRVISQATGTINPAITED